MFVRVEREVPSLVALCVRLAIRNLRYMGDVGETDTHLLERILPHCTVDQLRHIEKSTKGRDLTPVTGKLWRKFYERSFGVESAKNVAEKMKSKKVYFPWMQLYEAKLKETDERVEKSINRISETIQKQKAERKSRQVKPCTKVPPSSKRRSFGGNSISYNGGSKLMKKSILDLRNSHEMKNIAAMKKMAPQRNHSVSTIGKPNSFSGRNFASCSKTNNNPLKRTF